MKTKLIRWLITASCCCVGFAQAQTINKLEYFFDTDPGVGNGISVAINSTTNLDSNFTFDISALSNGLHMLYVRSQGGSNNWSLNYSTSFIKTNSPGGSLSIIKLEYFVDADPGVGNGIPIPLTTANVIDSTFDIVVPDNGANKRFFGIRAMDSYGKWSLIYSDSTNMCQLYKSKPNFSWIRFGDLFSFIDSTQNNPAHKLLWKFGNLGTDSVSNPQFTFPQGNYSTKLISGIGCRKDSIALPLFVGLENYYPDSAYNHGDIVLNFFGGGLDSNTVITLVKGASNIPAYQKISFLSKAFAGVFDLHDAASGNYDVKIHFPSGHDTTILNGLRVLEAPGIDYTPSISLTVQGAQVGRPNTVLTHHLIITNTGNTLAKSIPIWIAAENEANFQPGQGFTSFSTPAGDPNYWNSISTTTGIDSILGQPYQGRINSFILPALNAGESFTYTYSIQVPAIEGQVRTLHIWAGKPMFGSPFKWDCLHSYIDIGTSILGLVPVIGCAFGWVGFSVDFASGMLGKAGVTNDKYNAGNFGLGLVSSLIGCIPGLAAAADADKFAQLGVKLVNGQILAVNTGLASVGLTQTNLNPCFDQNDQNDILVRTRDRVSADPNQISGPQGYAEQNYITGKGKQPYEVFFENKPSATANAQRVYVADTLDKTKFDLSTFELTAFSLADSIINIPFQRKEFTTTLDLRPKQNVLLRYNAKLDTTTGILRCEFLSLDPDTHDTLPLSDLRGFLPADVDGVSGNGSISYVVNLKTTLITGDQVHANASIVFDNNDPIFTNTWLNTIDKTAPTGLVSGGTLINDTTVRLNLSGSDAESGLKGYNLYISENQKPYIKVGPVFGDTVRFTGFRDSVYRFYAVPYDSLYNLTDKSPVPEYSIALAQQSPLPVSLISFDAQKQQNDVKCTWQATAEINFSHYVVERSLDGSHFETAGIVMAQAGTGIKNYQFIDANAINRFSINKKLFYRLRMVDIDSTSRYSRIARLDFDKNYTVVVYPNPANNEIYVDGIQHYRSIQITDISGRVVISKAVIPSQQTINISTLNSGVYLLRLSGDDDIQSIRFIKQ